MPGINQAPRADRCSAGTEPRPLCRVSGAASPAARPALSVPPGRCTARSSPGRAGPSRAGRGPGWGGGKGRTLPPPRSACPQPAPQRGTGALPGTAPHRRAPRPRSLPNRFPPRRQLEEPGSEPCPRPSGRTHTHTERGSGKPGSRNQPALLPISSPVPQAGRPLEGSPRCFARCPLAQTPRSLAESPPTARGWKCSLQTEREGSGAGLGMIPGSFRDDRSDGHPDVHTGAEPCERCGCLHGQIDKRRAVCFCMPLYLDGCMQKFACTV